MVEAAVCGQVSEIYRELGAYDKAIEFGERSLAIRRKTRSISDAGTLCCMLNLALAYGSAAHNDKAAALFLEALPVAHRVLGEYDAITRLLHQNLADLYCNMGRDDEAEQHLARSFEAYSTDSRS
jgi:tetratricopeptide (TPR) repeat protein